MRIGLFRHAEKQSGFCNDLNLSPHGVKQALHLKDQVESGHLPLPTALLTSPKKRSYETFEPLAQSLRLPIQKVPALDERFSIEQNHAFTSRVQSFLNEMIAKKENTLYLCTHLDWIEELPTLLSFDTDLKSIADFSWSPAAYMFFEIRNDIWHVTDRGFIE